MDVRRWGLIPPLPYSHVLNVLHLCQESDKSTFWRAECSPICKLINLTMSTILYLPPPNSLVSVSFHKIFFDLFCLRSRDLRTFESDTLYMLNIRWNVRFWDESFWDKLGHRQVYSSLTFFSHCVDSLTSWSIALDVLLITTLSLIRFLPPHLNHTRLCCCCDTPEIL